MNGFESGNCLVGAATAGALQVSSARLPLRHAVVRAIKDEFTAEGGPLNFPHYFMCWLVLAKPDEFRVP